jgi:AraC-like DNA-binding protein
MPARYCELPDSMIPDAGIEAIWHSRSDRAGTYRVLPDGRCDLILRYASDAPNKIEAVLSGPASQFYDLDLQPGMAFVGARFKPGHAPRFLGMSLAQMPPEGLRGPALMHALTWLQALTAPAVSPEVLLARFGTCLAERAQEIPPPPQKTLAIAAAFHVSAGRMALEDLARIHRVSSRQLARNWRHLTGFSPKTYCMILQFQRALRLITKSGLSPAAAAYEAGYADQPHMTRAFHRFGGFSPARPLPVTLVTMRS